MAAAEARAVWQRTANRYFVQEDAKRAPKLTCCQSSSSSTKHFDSGSNIPSDGPDHPIKGFVPLNNNSLFLNLPPDSRWWVQMQPNYGYQVGLSEKQQKKALEIETETSKSPSNGAVIRKSNSICTDDHNEGDSSFRASACTKKASEVDEQNFIGVLGVKEGYELMNIDALNCKLVTKHSNEFGMDLDSPWTRIEKTVPWWRTSDFDELANMVSQKTHECIQNCDLPPATAHKLCVRPLVSKFDSKSQATSVCAQDYFDSIVTQRKQEGLAGNLGNVSPKSFSRSNKKDSTEAASKAELLEALRHSQTRAREAEKAAKQARAEKEHIIELIFKQASQLFAYRQWLRLLQFDQSFHIRVKKSSERLSQRRRAKHGRARDETGKYSIPFAVGLSLVGAGLVLGWTVGWMFPPF